MITWPNSPAVKRSPRQILPPITMPAPTPVPTHTASNDSHPSPAPTVASPHAATLASLSTVTGMPSRLRKISPSGTFFQPRLPAVITTPRSLSTGPGAPIPTVRISASFTFPASHAASMVTTRRSRTTSRPSCALVFFFARPTTLPRRSTTPTLMLVPPRSMPIASSLFAMDAPR